jgi:hypothetical protein
MTLPDTDVEAFPLSSVNFNPPPNRYISHLHRENIPSSNKCDKQPQIAPPQHVDSCGSRRREEGEKHNPTLEFFKELREKIKNADAGHCIFISGGSNIKSGWAVPVPIKNPKDDVATWRQIQESWYKSAGS